MFRRILVFILALTVLCLSSCDSGSSLDKTFISKAIPGLTWNSTIDEIKAKFKDNEVEVKTKEGNNDEKKISYVETTLMINDATVIDIKSNIKFSFINVTFDNIEYDYGLFGVDIGFLSSDVTEEKINKVFEEEKKNAIKSTLSGDSIDLLSYGYGFRDYSKISKETIDKQREIKGRMNEADIYTDEVYYEQPLITFLHSVFNTKASEEGLKEEGHRIKLFAEKYKMIRAVERQMNSK